MGLLTNRSRRSVPAFLDSVAPAAFTAREWMFLGGIILLLFLPTLFHPLSTDQGLFNLNGTMLLRGGVYYRDMVEMKPPLLSFMYAGANFIFRSGEYSIRFLDLLLQGATCWMIVALVRRSRGGDLLAAISALCYALIYLAQRYSQMAQAESYAGLFGLGIIWLALFRRSSGGMFLTGLLGGMLWLLKFPLAVLLLLPLAAELWLFRSSKLLVLRHLLMMGAGFAIVVGLFLLYLTANNAYDDFLLISEFTRGYAMTELRNPGRWLLNLVTVLPMHLVLDFSPVFFAAIVAAIPCMRRKRAGVSHRSDESHRSDASLRFGESLRSDEPHPAEALRHLLLLVAMAFLLLLATIVAEGKYPGYHFARIFPFGAILAGMGMYRLGWLVYERSAPRRRIVMLLAAGVVLLLGPLPFYGWRTLVPVTVRAMHPDSIEGFARYDFSVVEPRRLAAYITPRRQPGDILFAAASMGGQIYYHTGFTPTTPIYHFGFINATYGPSQWGDSIRNHILTARPRFIVAELGDSYPSTTGSTLTSDERLRRFPGIDSLIRMEYVDTVRFENLVVYERR